MNTFQESILRTYQAGAYKYILDIENEEHKAKALEDVDDPNLLDIFDNLKIVQSKEEALQVIREANQRKKDIESYAPGLR